ncbi:succinate-semialdehyde dehydrogenase (NADP(+)) [Mycobacterium sp. CBMA271]|uniref:succinic semialdehyde dehydrogenase n=1 Tax=unclassified Mycobacteroides TaxID=2618759 RepID=UPI0012DC8C28|nr:MULTISPECIES: succinic semialdehyde dehydrogenase [unclassified Mycobacteroides]MUM15920.1 succinic semialdehyde dehydrogenase [Mycobacteroides sp. CBMA 326]MUM24531.1 succinate-semialdehyde dehydrogenase (NADP(+)) [Mycobacteroides sp. CBMA 271]
MTATEETKRAQPKQLSNAQIQHATAALVANGPPVAVIAPFTGEVLTELPTSTQQDVHTAFERARQAQSKWRTTPVRERARIFLRFHDLALHNTELMDIIQAESGKSRNSAFEETLDVAGLSLYYGRNAPRYLAARRRKGALPLATRAVELRHPKGVVAVVSPFNYPLSLAVCDTVPALIAGNAVVHKPDNQAALTALRARALMVQAGLPEDLWQIVIGDPHTLGATLIDLADQISFTGSTQAGRRLAQAAATRLIGCTLELGGKNPMIVLDDADLDKAAKGAARACFSTTGQLCLSIERLYVHESVYDRFLDFLIRHTSELKLGNTFDFSYDIGTLSTQRQLDKTRQHVDQAVAAGAIVRAGGKPRPDLGPYFYEPTILTGVTPEMAVHSEETFGPVVSVYPFTSDDAVIEMANNSQYGLNASIWSRNLSRARHIGAQISAGTVNINEGLASAYTSNDAPMGGMKASGLGRRHGEHGLLQYCELQTIASQHLIGFDPLPGISTEQNASLLTQLYRLMKLIRIK